MNLVLVVVGESSKSVVAVREYCHRCGEKVERIGFNRKGYLLIRCGCCAPVPAESHPLCPFCKSDRGTVHVQGHDQCVTCKQVIDGCCTGESQEILSETEDL